MNYCRAVCRVCPEPHELSYICSYPVVVNPMCTLALPVYSISTLLCVLSSPFLFAVDLLARTLNGNRRYIWKSLLWTSYRSPRCLSTKSSWKGELRSWRSSVLTPEKSKSSSPRQRGWRKNAATMQWCRRKPTVPEEIKRRSSSRPSSKVKNADAAIRQQ